MTFRPPLHVFVEGPGVALLLFALGTAPGKNHPQPLQQGLEGRRQRPFEARSN